MSDGPLQQFRDRVASGDLRDDAAQRLAVEKLQLLHTRLQGYDPRKPARVGLALFGWGREKISQSDIPGLYIYGGVGRGKSMLMDLFFDGAPVAAKRRVHFHAFMQEVHAGMKAARAEGLDDPLEPVAAQVAEEAVLLCFDEMQITDIADAMIVGRLFDKLFARGVIVVTTSNRHPDDLYKDGLNRQLFLPFIDRIKEKLDIHHLESPTDHRQGRLQGQETYFTPLGPEATANMDAAWEDLAGGEGGPLSLIVNGRRIEIPHFRSGVGRASFEALCAKPLGPADYLAMADAVKVLLIDRIPTLSRAKNNEAKRFVTLVDALYEARVRLVCSAAAEPEALYVDGAGAFEFERTASRLREMQAADWPPAPDQPRQ
ncbi:cell division protein ZapE [Oceanomicrobium pacificus]|uniref:Cell division protein ZapE n=1 Tax=Oceanomicrobium pacificus TaxID=2692916 RepID=A0A6B0U7J8_9RHOB|nr:cell division protein ZapE [Oceanomicrobium pacificus]MXU66841.1 cell division protein ZapE [Oceanomicrobium pacificus]